MLLGRYRLVRLVAQGGMASVWEGHDNVLARAVAVKMLHPHLAQDRLFLERFRREAISAARLAHPNVVATFDAGITPEGTAFIVMELIRGRTLSAFASDHRPLPLFVTVEIAMQIADALAHAHASGLIHRDIKPANVLVCDSQFDDGVPLIKVTDFGIAKAAEGLGLELTKTGMILGTPKYLSPEQIEGREPDARADLYALGVVLFELVAGGPPFQGPSEMAIAVQHLNDAPAHLRDLRSGVPATLDALVGALLAKQPADRPPSAAALRQALAAIDLRDLRRHPAPSPSPTAALPSRPPNPLGKGERVAGPAPRSQPGPLAGPGAPRRPAPHSPTGPVAAPRRPAAHSPTGPVTGPRRPPPHSPTGPVAGPRRPAAAAPAGLAGPPGPAAVRRPAPVRRRPNWAGRLVAGLVVLALVVVVLVLSQGTKKTPTDSKPGTVNTGAPVHIQGVSVFHLERDADGAANVGKAIDGISATAWTTDHYFGPHFAGLRRGLGVAMVLDGRKTLHSLTVESPTTGWSAEVYLADAVPDPAELAPWGPPVAAKAGGSGFTTFDLGGRQGAAVLFWLTDLGPGNQTAIDELSLR